MKSIEQTMRNETPHRPAMPAICRDIRETILRISHHSRHGHIPSDFSVIEILVALYQHMRHDPCQPQWKGRDLFVLSKGHAALAHYCLLANLGYFPLEKVHSFAGFLSDFGCHSDRHKVPGVEASTGSLGHGIGLALGMALAARLKGSDQKVYTLVGDGESNEGTVWEALLVAASLRLSNFTVLYDNNRSHPRGLQIDNPEQKLAAFGCRVIETNGHNVDELKAALAAPCDTVKAIVASTIKGYPCQTLTENMYEWHGKTPDEKQLDLLLEELNAASI